MSATLRAAGLGVTAGTAQLLAGVDLGCEPGEFIAIVGPNGAGKSTLLKTLLGLSAPSAGTVTVGERAVGDIRGRERAGLLAWLPQRDAGVEPVRVVDRVASARFRFAGAARHLWPLPLARWTRSISVAWPSGWSTRSRVVRRSGSRWRRWRLRRRRGGSSTSRRITWTRPGRSRSIVISGRAGGPGRACWR